MAPPSPTSAAPATEAIHLLAAEVLDLGFRRFGWRGHDLNAASRRAAIRFGFTSEGTFRQAAVVKRRNRDTAWSSLLDHKWPTIRPGDERWSGPANFDALGGQRPPLAVTDPVA